MKYNLIAIGILFVMAGVSFLIFKDRLSDGILTKVTYSPLSEGGASLAERMSEIEKERLAQEAPPIEVFSIITDFPDGEVLLDTPLTIAWVPYSEPFDSYDIYLIHEESGKETLLTFNSLNPEVTETTLVVTRDIYASLREKIPSHATATQSVWYRFEIRADKDREEGLETLAVAKSIPFSISAGTFTVISSPTYKAPWFVGIEADWIPVPGVSSYRVTEKRKSVCDSTEEVTLTQETHYTSIRYYNCGAPSVCTTREIIVEALAGDGSVLESASSSICEIGYETESN